jgi:nucleoside phosphorylase
MIGIIGALADEVKKLAARLEDAKTVTVGGMEFTVGRIANH